MTISNHSQSHRRDIVSRLARDEQDAELLLELMLMTDAQTPMGAAAHLAVVDQLYEFTDDRRVCRDKFMRGLKEKMEATQVSTSQ